MKLLSFFIFVFFGLSLVSCSSSDKEEQLYKLSSIDYTDFYHAYYSNSILDSVNYDTISSDKNTKLLDTLSTYFSTANTSSLTSANQINFVLLGDSKIKYLSDGYQTIATREDVADSIFVLKDNNIDSLVFVVKNKDEIQEDYYRTISAYRVFYNSVDTQAIIEGETLTTASVLKKMNISSIDDLNDDDYLIWVNVYYRYQ